MADRTTHPAVAAFKRTACTLVVASVLAAGPAAAQTSPAEGAPPPDDKAAATLKRMEVNQATRMRDLMTMISLASSKKVAISVGAIDASADGTTVRLKNIVIVDRQGMSIQVLPLVEIRDLDQRHFIPRHFRIVTYSDIVVASLPPMAVPMIQAMGVKSLAARSSFEFKFDETAGTLDIRGFSFEWSGVARLTFNLQLTNVPPLNDMILLAADDRIEPRLGEIRLKSVSLALRNRSLNRVLETAAGMFMQRAPGGSALVAQLERLKAQARNDIERRMAEALLPAAEGPAIVTFGLASPNGVPLLALERLKNPLEIQNLFELQIEGRKVTAGEALPANLPAESRDTAIDKTASNPPAHACDQVGALPNDPDKKAEGVPDGKLDVPQVIADCYRATVEYPATARFHLQLARALLKGGLTPMANAQLKKAIELGSETAKTYRNATPK